MKQFTNIIHCDPEEWAKLAKEEPALYEWRRQMVIETFIQQAPASMQACLRELQQHIDAERNKAKVILFKR